MTNIILILHRLHLSLDVFSWKIVVDFWVKDILVSSRIFPLPRATVNCAQKEKTSVHRFEHMASGVRSTSLYYCYENIMNKTHLLFKSVRNLLLYFSTEYVEYFHLNLAVYNSRKQGQTQLSQAFFIFMATFESLWTLTYSIFNNQIARNLKLPVTRVWGEFLKRMDWYKTGIIIL